LFRAAANIDRRAMREHESTRQDDKAGSPAGFPRRPVRIGLQIGVELVRRL
jgi:hypothetical protein